MRTLRTILALFGACGALLAGAWAGGGFMPDAQAEAGAAPRASAAAPYPRRSDAGEIPVGDALVVNGQPMQLSVFYTGDPPARVAAFYADAFRKRGLLPVAAGDRQLGHVSVFDPEDGLQRFVTALPDRSGQTLVLVGVANPRHAPRLTAAASRAPYPVPDRHRAFLGYSSEDAGTRAHSGQFVTSLSAGEVADFYRARLSEQGYAEKREETARGMLVFAKRGETLSVAVQALEDEKGAAVFVNRVEGGP